MEVVGISVDERSNAVATVIEPPIYKILSSNQSDQDFVDFRLYIVFDKKLPRIPQIGTSKFRAPNAHMTTASDIEEGFQPLPIPVQFNHIEPDKGDVLTIKFILDSRRDRSNILVQYLFYPVFDSPRVISVPWTYPIRFECGKDHRFIVVAERGSFMALDETAFTMYRIDSPSTINRLKLHCVICMDSSSNHVGYQCGHSLCGPHHQTLQDQLNNDPCQPSQKKCERLIQCPTCRQSVTRAIKIVSRDSPCPIDNCELGPGEQPTFLDPCGCIIPHGNADDIAQLKVCPYRLCKSIIKSSTKIFSSEHFDD